MSSVIGQETVIPEPSRLLEGLRDTGYDFYTAVADIIDNSIAANATKIMVTAYITMVEGIRVSIADNGVGMNRDELIEAMRYGAPVRKEKHSLGKFGLGLKTASTSCCRRLKVVSRDSRDAELSCAVWDLDYIAQTSNWYLKFEQPGYDDIEELEKCASDSSGTIVVWENCDRLLSARYSNPSTPAFKAAFDQSLLNLKHYIAMVYERFLNPNDDRAQNVDVFLNGESIEAWDPFCKEFAPDYGKETFTVCREDENGTVTKGEVSLAAYIVPAKETLTDDKDRRRVTPSYGRDGLKMFGEDSLSGFYVYRENRLIHWGDWFGMPGIDFHQRLCRFELSFGEELDEVFQVDIKKSRIQVNGDLKEKLHDFAGPIKIEGKNQYRGQKRKAATKVSKGMHENSNAQLEKSQKAAAVKSRFRMDDDGNLTVSNRFGTTTVPYEELGEEAEFPITVVDSLEDGLLWRPAIIGGRQGVQLNSNHPFYQKFYTLNKKSSTAIQGMDSVFLAFAQAETSAWQQEAQDNLVDARYETSRILRKYADALPEVSIEDIKGEDDKK